MKSGATTIWERWDAIRRRRLDVRPGDELLQPLCLWRRLPVAVRRRRRLPAGSETSRASSTSSSSRRSSRRSRPLPPITTPLPAASRPAGRSTATRSTYAVTVPEGASGTLVLDAPTTPMSPSTARRCPQPAQRESAQPARARRPHGHVPDQQPDGAELARNATGRRRRPSGHKGGTTMTLRDDRRRSSRCHGADARAWRPAGRRGRR